MNRVNEHKFDRAARNIANAIGVGAAVLVVCGLVFGACMGCRYVIIDTGQQILHGK